MTGFKDSENKLYKHIKKQNLLLICMEMMGW